MRERLRELPSVDTLLQCGTATDLLALYGRAATLEAIRSVLGELRQELLARPGSAAGAEHNAVTQDEILSAVESRLADWMRPSLLPVINASGVILHTNLGRAPLSPAAARAVQQVSLGYSNLEYDLERGARGSRLVHAERLFQRLTGAAAALVVNNNAAALLLALTGLARRRRVIIARSQLVEIGDGFRVPDVMSQSGAKLVEVGATNRVHLPDYEAALQEPAAAIVHAHHSNFRITGFTAEPTLAELAGLARRYQVPLVDDLGSGALLDTARYGLAHEPTVQESLAAGADLVCFSGDKLLGGPQAGILLGRADLIAGLRKHPLARALRADKLCLAALSQTLLHYLKEEAEREIPVWRMIAAPTGEIEQRARQWAGRLGAGAVVPGQSTVGGGSLPEETLPTYLLALDVPLPNRFLARLRDAPRPVIARVAGDRVMLDPRTVMPEEEEALLATLKAALGLRDGRVEESNEA
jgi:L-seryl-tRNA(Ser) seleniumtransferase